MPAKKKQDTLGMTKSTTTYSWGGSTPAKPSKKKMYKHGGSVGGTPTSLPGGCGGMKKK